MQTTIDGVTITITYTLARNVSYNRANPHRLTATCECGVQFVQHQCSEKIVRHFPEFMRQAMRRHQASGYCKLVKA